MEEQITKTIFPPRITLKRTSINKKIGWEIASSSAEEKKELKLIVEMLKEINEDMEKAFTKIKEEVDKEK